MVTAGYTWRAGFPVRASAEAFAVQLRGLQSERGLIAVEDVLDAQRSEDAPLHEEIDWDDQSAALKFRIDFVRSALGALRVIPVDLVKEELSTPVRAVLPVRMAVRDNIGGGNVYAFVVNAEQGDTEELAVRVRSEALGQVRRLAQRFASIPGCEDIAERLISICDLY